MDKDVIQIVWPNQGRDGGKNRRQTHCPFGDNEWIEERSESRAFCEFTRKDCRYGLTDIRVPEHCPLRRGQVTVRLDT